MMPKTHLTEINKNKLDIISLVTSSVGFGFVLLACSEVGANGFSLFALISFVVGAIIVAYFFIRQTKIDNPMLETSVFSSKKFSISVVITAIVQLVFMGAIVMFPFLIQDVLGYSPTVSGLAMIPPAIVMGVMQPLTGR